MTKRATDVSAQLAVSVVIPTHNPRMDYMARVIEALRQQTLPREQWELLVVDNGSREPLGESMRQMTEGGWSVSRDQRSEVGEKKSGVGSAYAFAAANDSGVTGEGLKLTNLNFKTTEVDLGWHPNARVVREEELGLTFARLRGFAEAKGELIVMADDDNVLAPDYLETAVRIAREHPMLGAFGGKCLAEFEVEPPEWLKSRGKGLGLRDRGDVPQLFPEGGVCEASVSVGQYLPSAAPHAVSQTRLGEAVGSANPLKHRTTELPKHRVTRRVPEFPECAPIGAGMVLRREAAASYAASLHARGVGLVVVSEVRCFSGAVAKPDSPKNRKTEPPNHRPSAVITDRRGDSLASGGDNDICLTVIEAGWQVGYMPQLQLTHLIPKRRMTLDYHKRMARDSMKSFILMLDQHGIRPWPAMARWTYPLRVASNWWRVKAWQGPEQSLRFWGNVGMYAGRAALARAGKRS